MGIKDTLSKERITSSLKNLGKLRLNISHATIMSISALLLILFIAFTIRILPLRWEIPSGTVRLNEFDPYYQFILTRRMVESGNLLSPYWPEPWINYQSWYPQGLDMSHSLPGLPMTAAALYLIITFIGVNVPLMTFASILPAIFGTISCIIIYFIGKDIGGKPSGLLAALFLALSPSFIQRTALGFFDTEVPGILSLLLFILLFLRAIEENRTLRSSLTYTLGAALSLAYFIMGWGAAYYILGLSSIFIFALILLKRYSQRLLLTFSITFGIALFVATKFPEINLNYLTSGPVIPIAGVFLLLCLSEILRNNISARTKVILAVAFTAVIVGGFTFLWQFGYMQSIAGKFITVIDPFIRASNPLVESVAEHRVSAWGNIYYELGVGILFFLAGLYFTLRNPTNRNIFLLLFGVTSLYFAASMVRLLAVFAPAFSLLVAAGTVGILKPFYTLLREAPQIVTKAKRGIARVSKKYSGIAILLVFVLLVTQLAWSPQNSRESGMPRAYGQAYNPITITASSVPLSTNVQEWANMLLWTQDHLESTTVVCSWWDYGYWLTILGNVTTLADNATINATQIENIGFIFMANETYSLKMLEQYDAKYILVFVTLSVTQTSEQTYSVSYSRYGDEGKWNWMAEISGEARKRFTDTGFIDEQSAWADAQEFGNYTLGKDWVDLNGDGQAGSNEIFSNSKGLSSTVYELMSWAKQRWSKVGGGGFVTPDEAGVQPIFFTEEYFSGGATSPFTYVVGYDNAGNPVGLVPVVALYKIDWDAYHNATSTTG